MSSLEAISQGLLWAAGAPVQAEVAHLDVDEFLRALREHRLEGRLLHRSHTDGVALPPELRERVEGAHRDVVARVHEQIALFADVRDAIAGRGLVPVKGFGLYALTQRPEHAAFSWDVDVLGADPHDVASAVEATGGTGFHLHGEEHPYVFAHMDNVEVHSRYVVTGMPRTASPVIDVHGGHGHGTVEIEEPFSIRSVWYDDLVGLVVPGVGAAEGIDVLRPEMAVLIRCAHVYVSFAMHTQPRPYATVRLEELAQMRDYLDWDTFDADLFLRLHERYDAGLVTDFARRLHLDLLGDDPFEKVLGGEPPIRSSFPRNLWWDGIDAGFPVDLPWDAHTLVAAPSDQPDLADLLGASTVVLDPSGNAVVDFFTTGSDHSERFIFHRYGRGLASVQVAFAATTDGVRATVRLSPVADGDMAAIGWATGPFRYELFYRPREGSHDFSDYSHRRASTPPVVELCASGADGVTLTVDFPWAALGRSGPLESGDSLPLTFRCRAQERPWGTVHGGLVAPIRLLR